MSYSTDKIQSMHGKDGYWCQAEVRFVPGKTEEESRANYKAEIAKGEVGIYSYLPWIDAFKMHVLNDEKNLAYEERNKMLVALVKAMQAFGHIAGIGKDKTADEEWSNVIFIDLPTGQVSFHIHNSELKLFAFLNVYQKEWDGHNTQEKWSRLLSYYPVQQTVTAQ